MFRSDPARLKLLFIDSEGLPCRLGRHLTYPGLAVIADTVGKDCVQLYQIVLAQLVAIVGGADGFELALEYIIGERFAGHHAR